VVTKISAFLLAKPLSLNDLGEKTKIRIEINRQLKDAKILKKPQCIQENGGGKRKVNFETSKILGGIGALLLFVSPFTGVATAFSSGAVGLVGFILLLIGAYGLAQYYRESGIFNNMLYGTVVGIVGAIVSVAVAVWAFISLLPDFIYKIYPNWNGDWTSLPNMDPTQVTNVTFSDVTGILGVFFAIVIALFIVSIIVAILYRKSFNQLSDKSGTHLFRTTGTVLLVGSVLVIIFGLGLLLVWISSLLLAIAFFQMRPSTSQTAYSPNQMQT
jgi:uncharacterized membrane protein